MIGNQARFATLAGILLAGFLVATGCGKKEVAEEKDEPSKLRGFFNKQKQDIKPADPAENRKQGQVQVDENLISGPIQAGQKALVKLDTAMIKHTIEAFRAEHGRYPRDDAEFKEKIIEANNIKLQNLPPNLEYQYDAQKYELIVVEKQVPPDQEKSDK